MNSTPVDDDYAQTAKHLTTLAATIESRRGADPTASYVAKLFAGGIHLIAKKVGEEAIETVLAAASEDADSVIRESADLVFHLMVLWSQCGVGFADVAAELARRERLSGIEEKRQRPAST